MCDPWEELSIRMGGTCEEVTFHMWGSWEELLFLMWFTSLPLACEALVRTCLNWPCQTCWALSWSSRLFVGTCDVLVTCETDTVVVECLRYRQRLVHNSDYESHICASQPSYARPAVLLVLETLNLMNFRIWTRYGNTVNKLILSCILLNLAELLESLLLNPLVPIRYKSTE